MNCIPSIPMSLVKVMHEASMKCVKDHPDKKRHPFYCENVYWTPSNECGSYTLHTHLVKNDGGQYPSDADRRTTKNLGKSNLCIINTEGRWIKCWNKSDNFERPILTKAY